MVISSSQKEMFLWICGVILTAASLFGLSILIEQNSPRQPASIAPGAVSVEKLRNLKPTDHPFGNNQAKGSSLVEVELRAPAKKPFLNNAFIDLEAVIRAHGSTDGLQYTWILPDGVTLESGEMSGSLGNLAEGQETALNIKLVSHSDENKLIHLHVFKMIGAEAMGYMAQFNTVDQEKINDELTRKAEVLSAQESESPVKMMQ